LYRLVENLAITAGMKVAPKIYIIDDPAPNAFATGRDPEHSSVAFTTGLLQLLDKQELEAVAAHELSHIKNFDIRLGLIVIVFVGMITFLSYWFLRFGSIAGGGRGREGGSILGILMLVGLLLAVFSPLIARVIQAAMSRKREFLADADGSLLTRYPEGLASALEKISGYSGTIKRMNRATAHLYISNPLRTRRGWLDRLYSTHPPVEERIKILRAM
jgi:heat shock protein HtpX